MIALGVWHHGDPDWFYSLPPDHQTEVLAIIDIQRSEHPLRYRLPVPLDAYGWLDVNGRIRHAGKPARRAPEAPTAPPRGPGITVRDGHVSRPATAAEEASLGPAVAAMKRASLVKHLRASGASEEKLQAFLGWVQ